MHPSRRLTFDDKDMCLRYIYSHHGWNMPFMKQSNLFPYIRTCFYKSVCNYAPTSTDELPSSHMAPFGIIPTSSPPTATVSKARFLSTQFSWKKNQNPLISSCSNENFLKIHSFHMQLCSPPINRVDKIKNVVHSYIQICKSIAEISK